MSMVTRSPETQVIGRARVRVWALMFSLSAIAILAAWLFYARLSHSAEFVEGRFNYKLLQDPRWQDIAWKKCDPIKKDAELAVTWTDGDTCFRLCLSIVNGSEGMVQVFAADNAPQEKARPLAVYRYHERELTAIESSLAPEDRALVQQAGRAICEFLRKSL